MNFLAGQNTLTKITVISAIALLFYGYSAKIFSIYFFWESTVIGWMVAFIATICVMTGLIRQRKPINKSTIVLKLSIVVLALTLVVLCIFLAILPRTDAYEAADKFFRSDSRIKDDLGQVSSTAVLPVASIEVHSGPENTVGEATLWMIVKGKRKYRQYRVHVIKTADSDQWLVDDVH